MPLLILLLHGKVVKGKAWKARVAGNPAFCQIGGRVVISPICQCGVDCLGRINAPLGENSASRLEPCTAVT